MSAPAPGAPSEAALSPRGEELSASARSALPPRPRPRDAHRLRLRLLVGLAMALPVLLAGGILAAASRPHPPLERTLLQALAGWSVLVGGCGALALALLAPRWLAHSVTRAGARLLQSVTRLRELVLRQGRAAQAQAAALVRLEQALAELDRRQATLSRASVDLARATAACARISEAGQRVASSAQRAMRDVDERVGLVAARLDQLDQRCVEVEAILSFLDHLGQESNRLGVNAALRAAEGAGAGAALGLVADELRQLAEQAVDAVRDVHHRLDDIRGASGLTQTATADGRREVQSCLAALLDLEAGFGRLGGWVEETHEAACAVEDATRGQRDALSGLGASLALLERRSAETEGASLELVEAIDELAAVGEGLEAEWRAE